MNARVTVEQIGNRWLVGVLSLLVALLFALSVLFSATVNADNILTCENTDDHGNCIHWTCTGTLEQCMEAVDNWED